MRLRRFAGATLTALALSAFSLPAAQAAPPQPPVPAGLSWDYQLDAGVWRTTSAWWTINGTRVYVQVYPEGAPDWFEDLFFGTAWTEAHWYLRGQAIRLRCRTESPLPPNAQPMVSWYVREREVVTAECRNGSVLLPVRVDPVGTLASMRVWLKDTTGTSPYDAWVTETDTSDRLFDAGYQTEVWAYGHAVRVKG